LRLKEDTIKNNIIILDQLTKNEEKKLKKRENHLLEYLIYNYTDKNGKDILPQGNYDTLNNVSFNEIRIIMKELLNNPSKIKIILASHFKTSSVKKIFLNYFKSIINTNNGAENNLLKNENESIELKKKKMIYYNISDSEKNFIKINYYIDDKGDNLMKLHNNSGYFNYLKYILDETNENSLHYELREKYNISSLSCDFEVILKSKIQFSINIYLNNYTYNSLDNIIYKVYEYIYNITKYINSLNDLDSRALELDKIVNQNFSFTEDCHEAFIISKKRALSLFYKNDQDIYLKDMWLPGDFNKSIHSMKEITNQLTPNNSVVILGFNDYTLKQINDSIQIQNIADLFKESNIRTTNYFSTKYSCLDLNIDFEKNYINNESYIISEHNNTYISNYTSDSKLEYDINDTYRYYSDQHESINRSEDGLKEFFFKKDTSFKLPKVYITLYFFHPYLRANSSSNANDDNFVDNKFFEIVLYIEYIKREINFKLSDAIRAGNSFSFSFNQNLFFIDIFAFSDVVEIILEVIKHIIESSNFYDEISENFEHYRELALKDFLNPNSINLSIKLRYSFYQYLTKIPFPPSVYNYYGFPYEVFNVREKDDILVDFDMINSFIVQGFIYGYYNKSDAINLFNNFYISNIEQFKSNLNSANLNYSLFSNITKFTTWLKTKNDLDKTYEDKYHCSDNSTKIYRFISFSNYTVSNSIYAEVYNLILKSDKSQKIQGKIFTQQQIFAQFTLNDEETRKDFQSIINNMLNDKKKDYDEVYIDVIGSRLYYIFKNVIENWNPRKNMKSCAISSMDSNFYEGENFEELYRIKEMKYEEFSDIIKKKMNNAKYVDFICNNKIN
jgi:hypothetical protein